MRKPERGVAQASAAAQLARALMPHARRPASPVELVPRAVRTVLPASRGGSAAPLAVPSPGAAPRSELVAEAKAPGVVLPAPAAPGAAE